MLLSKLFLPELRPSRVGRARLLERLQRAVDCQLIVIAAPAGFGKTTLANEWVRSARYKTAWISVDEGDNDPARFWAGLVTATDQLYPGAGQNCESLLAARPIASPQAFVTTLLNDLLLHTETRASDLPACLVLDDMHLVTNAVIYEGLLYLIEHLPRNLRLVLVGRSDPPIPLGRLRANGRVFEIRAADLRFSLEESEDFLNRVMGFRLSPELVKRLEQRTEGWIAGLQLAGLALQAVTNELKPGDNDAFVQDFIESFSGNDRYILDYLVEEVLCRLPEAVRAFLLQTAILDRMCGPLCDAVADLPAGQGQVVLEQLERENLFLVPLDNCREWYRYHHLFGDLLRRQLERQGERGIQALRRNAAGWLAAQGFFPEAASKATQAHDFEQAAQWIEGYARGATERGEYASLRSMIEALPSAVLYSRPELLMQYVWTLNYLGEVTQYERPLAAAEQLWREQGDLARLGEALNLRADFAAAHGDSERAAGLAQQALDLLPEDQAYHRGMSWLYVGSAALMQGEMEQARCALDAATRLCRQGGNATGGRLATLNLAQVYKAQAKLPEAARLLEELISLPGSRHTYEGLAARLLLGAIWREWNRLAEAEEALRGGLELAETTGQIIYLSKFYLHLALILWQKGDAAGMQAAFDRHAHFAEQMRDPAGQARGAALRAQVAVLSGDLETAQAWRALDGVCLEDPACYADEAPCLALARLLIRLGCGEASHAVELTEKLQHRGQAQQRTSSLIELLMLKAVALHRVNDAAGACEALEESLRLAQPGGYRRLYGDEGRPLADLLAVLVRKPGLSPELRAYATQLLMLASHHPEADSSDGARVANLRLLEPLTPREMEVLRLIRDGLSNREIAERLFLTLNTVKVHAKNIFAKLDVASRTQAVRRAEELELV